MSGGAQGTADGTPGWVAAPGLDNRGCNNLLGEASKSNLKLGNLQGLVALAPWYGGDDRGRGPVGQHPLGTFPWHPVGTRVQRQLEEISQLGATLLKANHTLNTIISQFALNN